MQNGLSKKNNRANTLTALLFLLPNIIGFMLFTSLPVAASLVISLFNWPVLGEVKFVGLDNFRRLLTVDPSFWQVIFNTTYYSFGYVTLNVVLAMSLAMWLTRRASRFKGLFRAVFFVPQVTPLIATSMIWRWLYEPDAGLINQFIGLFGLAPIRWLVTLEWAMPAVILMSVWQGFGYNMVIFIAGIEGIPKTLIEAAVIDGAGAWTRFRRVILPLLSPSIFFAVVMTVISSFQVFDQTFILTEGGPYNATNTMVLYLYQNAFIFYKMGYASAIAWVLFAVIFTITLVQMRLQKEWVVYE